MAEKIWEIVVAFIPVIFMIVTVCYCFWRIYHKK